ncbi:CDP-diacylglycerol--serine O-phosphatidyltransferase [candidate division KSB1 bacterium]
MKNKRAALPNFFTLANSFLGFLSILYASDGRFLAAAWCITFATICDSLDGKLARLSKTSSKFGVQLDSLSDIISFGVAPAFLVYATNFASFGIWGAFLSFLFIFAGIFRLARFNVTTSLKKKSDFKGLPIPVAALAIATFFVFTNNYFGTVHMPPVIASMVIALSALMVSNVEYKTIPSLRLFRDFKKNILPVSYIIGYTVILFTRGVLFFPFVLMYIAVYFIKWVFPKYNIVEDEPDYSVDEENIV